MKRTIFVEHCEECPFYHEVDHRQGVDEHCTLGYDAPADYKPWEERKPGCSVVRVDIESKKE